ncbi:MAG: NADH-quinone oxidoreductase subunit J [Planctomycetota bacterium]|jgi:NADH-quinone oxidoreductase subunit J
MAPTILYTVTILGAAGLYLLLRPGVRSLRMAGGILGLAAVSWLLVNLATAMGSDARPGTFFLIFSLIAVASAARMITHTRPVYAALYFVLVVLASAGLFLLLGSEFMAFALVIVYAGAILVTYVFVLMLAQQAPDPNDPTGTAEYDRSPREPAAAATVGFILLALLATVLYDGAVQDLSAPTVIEAKRSAWRDLQLMPQQLDETVRRLEPTFRWPEDEPRLTIRPDGVAQVEGFVGDDTQTMIVTLPDAADPRTGQSSAMPENLQRVGLSLVADFPASLELAGVILLLAMFGAVVLARKQIELGEDELRAAAGLRSVSHYEDYDVTKTADEEAGDGP